MNHRDATMTDTELVRYATYYRAPAALDARVRTSVRFVRRPARFDGVTRGFALAASLAFVSIVSWNGARIHAIPSAEDELAREVTTAHVRSLIVDGHLNDVISTDRHTVKPWFSGRLDFSPPVEDFTAAGLRLTGGRLDYLDGRSVAVLTYAHEKHVLNLFVWPARTGGDVLPTMLTRHGYAMEHWTDGGMNYWLVADVDPRQLASLATVIRKEP